MHGIEYYFRLESEIVNFKFHVSSEYRERPCVHDGNV